MKKKEKKKVQPPPVVTGHDDRAVERAEQAADGSGAPDGISGSWS